jgi:tRNA nucleotidyltransferase (CCA-adding enzyme)
LLKFVKNDDVRIINEVLKKNDFKCYFVGGCIRDSLMGIEPKDIDLCTDATPQQMIECFSRDRRTNMVLPTGLMHGTLTVILNKIPYEITTLRIDANHDGRHAEVTFTDDLTTDQNRRDLTINSMAMDFDGNIIDPFGGQDDLINRKIRFVGDADARIIEDYLRILRWFRFHQRFANGTPFDAETMDAIRRNADGMKIISVERIWAEISKAMTYDNPTMLFKGMEAACILPYLRGVISFDRMASMATAAEFTKDPLTRFAIASTPQAIRDTAESWKWSNQEKAQALFVVSFDDTSVEAQKKAVAVEKAAPYYVAEACRARGVTTDIESWDVPSFPVTGYDLMQAGMAQGPAMGGFINYLKNVWADSGYTMTKEMLLTY